AIERLGGAPVPASALETLVLPGRVPGYSPALLDELTSAGEIVWSGAGALPGGDGWLVRAPADGAPLLLPEPAEVSMTPPRAAPRTVSGRWAPPPPRDKADPTLRANALAMTLLDRHGVLTRGAVAAERVTGGFAAVYPVLRAMEEAGQCRRGYFVEGLGGAQFALPGAVDRMRALGSADGPRAPSGVWGGGPACRERGDPGGSPPGGNTASVLAAADPA